MCHNYALAMQLKIFKYLGAIRSKVIPNLSIDREILLGGNRIILPGVIYHEGEQSLVDIVYQDFR